jgi:glycosyltransferase involved in cell wall biosynthesis
MKKKTVFVGIPIHRSWSHESQTYFEKNLQAARSYEVVTLFKMYEESLIQRARNNIMRNFLEKSRADYFFFIDDDIVPMNPDAIDQLVEADKDIIAGVYIMKKPPYKPTFYPLNGEPLPDIRKLSEPFQVDYVATGFTLYRRNVCRAMFDNTPYPFDCFDVPKIGYLSEDWAFCHRAKALGFKCWIHPKPQLAHLGIYAYSLSDYYQQIEMEKEKNA